jgi:hypothetical protein
VRALNAEGLENGVWQSFILPAMTVFQNKDGYGHGCPWSCPHAEAIDYTPERFPAAVRHCDTHTGMTTPLRAPNGPQMAKLAAQAIRKAMAKLAGRRFGR